MLVIRQLYWIFHMELFVFDTQGVRNPAPIYFMCCCYTISIGSELTLNHPLNERMIEHKDEKNRCAEKRIHQDMQPFEGSN